MSTLLTLAELIVMLPGVPAARGCWWGLVSIVLMTILIVWRLLLEGKFLAKNLSGYADYQHTVKYRS